MSTSKDQGRPPSSWEDQKKSEEDSKKRARNRSLAEARIHLVIALIFLVAAVVSIPTSTQWLRQTTDLWIILSIRSGVFLSLCFCGYRFLGFYSWFHKRAFELDDLRFPHLEEPPNLTSRNEHQAKRGGDTQAALPHQSLSSDKTDTASLSTSTIVGSGPDANTEEVTMTQDHGISESRSCASRPMSGNPAPWRARKKPKS